MFALFYAYNGLLASLKPSRLKTYLDVLVGLFDRLVLQTNVKNEFGMV